MQIVPALPTDRPVGYQIIIKDSTGQVVNTLLAKRFAIITEGDNCLSKTFSSNSLVDQLGLLTFALEDVRFEKSVVKSREVLK